MTKSKSRRLSILTYGGWFNTFQRPHHLAGYLRKDFHISVINNVLRVPFRGYGYMAEQEALADRLLNIYLLKEDERYPALKMINRLLYRPQSLLRLRSPEFRSSQVVYTWHMEDIGYLDRCADKLVVYDAMDDWAAFSDRVDRRLIDNEREVVRRADMVLAVSRKLYERHRELNANTHLLPNGVDADFFRAALTREAQESDPLYPYRGRPVVGYVGGIHDWVDVELMVEAARLLPDVTFALIGPVLKWLRPMLDRAGNIVYLGPRPYSELIGHVSYFRAGIIPFKLNLLNESTNPIKLFEYLGAGLPVVSTGMREVLPLAADGVVHIADDPAAFAREILKALALADDPGLIRERLRIAGENSWAERGRTLLGLIDRGLAARGVAP